MVQAGEGAVKTAAAKSTPSSVVETAGVEGTKSAPAEPAGVKSAPVKPPAAVGRSIGEVWLAECSSAEQSSCDNWPSPSSSGSDPIFF